VHHHEGTRCVLQRYARLRHKFVRRVTELDAIYDCMELSRNCFLPLCSCVLVWGSRYACPTCEYQEVR
jgi:hypothetical protein